MKFTQGKVAHHGGVGHEALHSDGNRPLVSRTRRRFTGGWCGGRL